MWMETSRPCDVVTNDKKKSCMQARNDSTFPLCERCKGGSETAEEDPLTALFADGCDSLKEQTGDIPSLSASEMILQCGWRGRPDALRLEKGKRICTAVTRIEFDVTVVDYSSNSPQSLVGAVHSSRSPFVSALRASRCDRGVD